MDQADDAAPQRHSRFWLFAPFVLIGLVIVGWTAAWFLIRDRAESEIDAALAREVNAGRRWTCAERRIGGFPFRIEVSCRNLSLARADGMTLDLGAARAVAQVYQPRHVIAEVAGPLRLQDGPIAVTGEWRRLAASLRGVGRRTASLDMEAIEPRLQVAGVEPGSVAVEAASFEAHARRSPGRPDQEGTVDAVIRTTGLRNAALDTLTANDTPAVLEVQARVTQALAAGRGPLPTQVERWRTAGGRVELELLDLAKGPVRVQAKGNLGVDEMHRADGRIQASGAGVGQILNTVLGTERAGPATLLLGALTGERRRGGEEPGLNGAKGDLSPLPPVRLASGRIYVGPLPIPGVQLPPLY